MNPRIMFIDDEQNVLDGIENALYKKRKEWDLSYFSSPSAAISAFEKQTYDVVVTDMRMPGVTGTDILQKLRDTSPSTVRVLLSGQADTASLITSLPNVHQYIRKPCQDGSLQAVIERSIALREQLVDERLRAELGAQETLPANPLIYWQIVRGIERDMTPGHLCQLIETDPGIYSKVLQLANSAYFGSNRPVVAIREAMSALGDAWFQLMAMSGHVFVPFETRDPDQRRSMEVLWKRAVVTRNLAAQLVDGELTGPAFTAGLLHGVGEQWILSVHPTEYSARHSNLRVDSGQIGAYLLALWGLPIQVVQAIRGLHVPLSIPVHAPLDVASGVRIAASVAIRALSKELAWPMQEVDAWLSATKRGAACMASLENELALADAIVSRG